MRTRFERVAWLLLAAMCVSVPAVAQVDLTGTWVQISQEDNLERGLGLDLADYTGLPINDEARARALTYDPISLSLQERQCIMYPPWYLVLGPALTRIASDPDPVTGAPLAWRVLGTWDRGSWNIWMDGRPHPLPNARHTDGGFTTGVWQGKTLKTYTTHFKEGPLRRTGVPVSDQTTLTTYFTRHGEYLTVTMFFEDPVYLAEPHVLTRHWRREPIDRPVAVSSLRTCSPTSELPEERGADGNGTVPNYLPDQNPAVNDFAKTYGLPIDAVMGGPETLYPEYQKKLKGTYVAPDKCTRYCCMGWGLGKAPENGTLGCIMNGSGTLR